MIATAESDRIEDFVAFVEHLTGDSLPRRGASMSEIERLTNMMARPLPQLYLAFLTEFGADPGPLFAGGDLRVDLGALLPFYELQLASSYLDVPFDGATFALGHLGRSRSLMYDELDAAREPWVIDHFSENVCGLVASTFRNWLYRHAYAKFRQRPHDATLFLFRGGTDLARPIPRLTDLGFISYWFADDHGPSAERGDDWLWGERWNTGESLTISISDPTDRRRLVDHLSDSGFRIS